MTVNSDNEWWGFILTVSICLNPECLHQNAESDRYCQKCGAKLRLGDRYRAIKMIGEGAFGRTFKAIDEQRLNRYCVIKQFIFN